MVSISAQGIEGEEKSNGQGKPPKDQHILLAWGERINAKAKFEIFLKATRLIAGPDVTEGSHWAAAHGAAKAARINRCKGCSHLNS